MAEYYNNRHRTVEIRDFPPIIRVAVDCSAREELFSKAIKEVSMLRREYDFSANIFKSLYGVKKSRILRLLLKGPQTARYLVENSELSSTSVYTFLGQLEREGLISKKKANFYLQLEETHSFLLSDIMKIEGDSKQKKKSCISINELALGYFLRESFMEMMKSDQNWNGSTPGRYPIATAVHRWKNGRTTIPVWALNKLINLTELDILQKKGNIKYYHVPPGKLVIPYYDNEYKLPVYMNSDLDKIVIQILQRMSRNRLYTSLKKRKWLFEKLYYTFGQFDNSTYLIPSAIIMILEYLYGVNTMDRSSARIPSQMKVHWSKLDPLLRMREQSSILLHIVSFSSSSNSGIEITSRSRLLLEDLSEVLCDLGLNAVTVHEKRNRPHFRIYLSETKIAALMKFASAIQEYSELEIWTKIPLNRITERLLTTGEDHTPVEVLCREELSRFVESILRSLERKTSRPSLVSFDLMQFKEEIIDYFWQQRIIPSPRSVEELLKTKKSVDDGHLRSLEYH